MTAPDRLIPSADGTPIAVFRSGDPEGSPVLLVHGTTADHTTFRTIGPMLGTTYDVHAMDRRGRGGSGDTLPYSIKREFQDVASVAAALASDRGRPVDLIGHSYGGRTALGAVMMSNAVGRIVCYEGAPAPPGASYHPPGIEDRLRDRLDAGDRDGALALFMAEVVGLSDEALTSYRANPVWPLRAAAADTILRELEAEQDTSASLEILGGVPSPILQILGSDSLPVFHDATYALDGRLGDSRIVVIEGARHAAHHTHPEAFVAAVRSFLT